jgi:hypothetical protein
MLRLFDTILRLANVLLEPLRLANNRNPQTVDAKLLEAVRHAISVLDALTPHALVTGRTGVAGLTGGYNDGKVAGSLQSRFERVASTNGALAHNAGKSNVDLVGAALSLPALSDAQVQEVLTVGRTSSAAASSQAGFQSGRPDSGETASLAKDYARLVVEICSMCSTDAAQSAKEECHALFRTAALAGTSIFHSGVCDWSQGVDGDLHDQPEIDVLLGAVVAVTSQGTRSDGCCRTGAAAVRLWEAVVTSSEWYNNLPLLYLITGMRDMSCTFTFQADDLVRPLGSESPSQGEHCGGDQRACGSRGDSCSAAARGM